MKCATATTLPTLLSVMLLLLTGPRANAAAVGQRTLVVDLGNELQQNLKPLSGFLGGLLPSIPDSVYRELHPIGFRIGHQFRVGRYELNDAIDRVHGFGAHYKLVMSDLIGTGDRRGESYEQSVRRLVEQVGKGRALRILWEPCNEPDLVIARKQGVPIQRYYELYERAFKVLQSIDPRLQMAGPGLAHPSYAKYEEFFEFCRQKKLHCNYVTWHVAGWDCTGPLARDVHRLPELIKLYRDDLGIRENHCDEWGGPPWHKDWKRWGTARDPAAQLVYFHYLEQVYKVDHAGRANWGRKQDEPAAGDDNCLGNIVTRDGQPYPSYHVYRMYAQTRGQTRVRTEGCDPRLACLASRQTREHGGSIELIVGAVEHTAPVVLVLQGVDLTGAALAAWKIPADAIESDPATPQRVLRDLPEAQGLTLQRQPDGFTLTIPAIRRQEVFRVVLSPRPSAGERR